MRFEVPAYRVTTLNCDSPAPVAPAQGMWRRGYGCCKALIEWLLALLLSIPATAIILLCAAIVKMTSKGSALHSQIRLGRDGRHFRMYKIRTMPENCEADTGPVWSTPRDARVTRFARFLRDTHIDELPQLWNVLKGEMTLIGPRPERPIIVERLERALPRYRDRLLVRPGLTGLAQIQLPPDSNLQTVRRKLAYDLHYVHRLGPWLDLRISVGTVFYLFGMLSTAMSRELIRSDHRAAEHRVESIEFLDDETCDIGTS